MKHNKRVLIVGNVIGLSRTNLRLRERRGIEVILKSGRYAPFMIVTEPVLLNRPGQYLHRTFEDDRLELYYIPNFTVGSLSSTRLLGTVGKLMYGLSSSVFQFVYILHLTLLVLGLTVAKKIDLIHAHNPPDLTGIASLLVSKITQVPYVFEVHDRTPELYCGEMGFAQTSFVYKLMKTFEHLVITNSAGVVTVNERSAEYFKSYGGPTPVSIHMGSSVSFSESIIDSPENRQLLCKRIILYQGALDMAKIGKPATYDLELPLKAMPYILSKVPNSILVYVGDGTGRSVLEEKARLMGLHDKVIFTGFLPQEQVFDWIGKADVVLVPYADNPNNYTTVPTKLYEYMAVGKPIIATRFPGILDIIEKERNGLLYEVNSLDNFRSCVVRILEDPELSEKLSTNAKGDFFSKYSLDKNWPKLLILYDSILS